MELWKAFGQENFFGIFSVVLGYFSVIFFWTKLENVRLKFLVKAPKTTVPLLNTSASNRTLDRWPHPKDHTRRQRRTGPLAKELPPKGERGLRRDQN